MTWKRTETENEFRPIIYVCECFSVKLTLAPPYKSDPWTAHLTTKSGTLINKECFRLRTKERDENKWESIEDLEKAKEKAFELMENYIDGHLTYWNALKDALKDMKKPPVKTCRPRPKKRGLITKMLASARRHMQKKY